MTYLSVKTSEIKLSGLSSQEVIFIISSMIGYSLLLFSPLISFVYFFGLLAAFNIKTTGVRYAFSLGAILSASLIYSSRQYLISPSDDFGHYYSAYLSIANGGSIFIYAGGLEFLLPLYFKVLTILFDPLQPSKILFFVCFFNSLVFYVWLENFGLSKVSARKRCLCLALSLSFYIYPDSIQLMRQMLSTSLLLFALSYSNISRPKSLFFLFLSSAAHLTAIPIFMIIYTFMNLKSKRSWVILAAAIFFVITSKSAISFSSSFAGVLLIGDLVSKLEFYKNNDWFILGSYLKYMFPCLISSLFFFSKKNPEWKRVLFFGSALYLILLPLPFASNRTMMLLASVLPGYIIYLSAERAIFPLRLMFLLFLTAKTYLLLDGNAAGEGFSLWYSYPWISSSPLYFF